jgi:hypothetical protein
MKTLKFVTLVAFVASLMSIICGYSFDVHYSQKLIGFGVAGLFLVVFPLFSYYRWKDRDFRDYLLNKENMDKMREVQKEKEF